MSFRSLRRRLQAWVNRLFTDVGWTSRVLLFIYGLALTVLALWDLISGDEFYVRLGGAALLCFSLVILIGHVVWLLDRDARRPRVYVFLAADTAVLVPSLWLIYRVYSNFDPQPRPILVGFVVVWASLLAMALALGDGWFAWRVAKSHSSRAGESDSTSSRSAGSGDNDSEGGGGGGKGFSGILAAVGTLLGAGIALGQFWHAVYEPFTAKPAVTVRNDIEEVRVLDGKLEIKASIRVKNSGKSALRILNSLYEITGTDVKVRDSVRDEEAADLAGALSRNFGPVARHNRYFDYSMIERIQDGPVFRDYEELGPGQEVHMKLMAHAPQGKFDLLRITTEIAAAHADRVAADAKRFPEKRSMKTCEVAEITEVRRPLEHPGAVAWLTNGDRELVIGWKTGDARNADSEEDSLETGWRPRFPSIYASLQHVGRSCGHALEASGKGLEKKAMLRWANAVSEEWVPET